MDESKNDILVSILATYSRTEESFKEDVSVVRKWIENQPYLPEIMDDNRICNFLLLNKCSIEKTKDKIGNYYTIRTLVPDFYRDVDDPEVLEMREIAYWIVLPKKTEEMCNVHVCKIRKPDLIDHLHPAPYWSQCMQIMEVRLKEDVMYMETLIIDMEGFNWGYLLKLTPTLISKCLKIFNKVFSSRLRAMHIVNVTPILDQVLAIGKTVMKPKLFQRIHLHKNADILQELFSKELLPKDYGGEEKSMEELHELQKKKLDEYKDWIHTLNRMKVDENLRPEKLENDDFLGFHGNFKKLNVD